MEIPWESILSGIGGGAFIGVLFKSFLTKITEKSIETQFEKKLELHKQELNKILETHKADMSVLTSVRIDLLKDNWNSHKLILSKMTSIMFELSKYVSSDGEFDKFIENSTLQKSCAENLKKLSFDLNNIILDSGFLVSDEQELILQKFLDCCDRIFDMLNDNLRENHLPSESEIREIWKRKVNRANKLYGNPDAEEKNKDNFLDLFLQFRDKKFIYNTRTNQLNNIKTDYHYNIVNQFGIADVAPWLKKTSK